MRPFGDDLGGAAGDPKATDPHAAGSLLRRGPAPGEAPVGLVLIHGRGDSAAGILSLVDPLEQEGAGSFSTLAPEAVGNVWYPQRFMEPVAYNQPWLDSALASVARAVGVFEEAGLPRERIVVAGFSQGACLALEYVAREGGVWGAVVGLSGGLIGDRVDPATYPASLEGTQAFLGCSDVDFHIPEDRVHASAAQLAEQGASVTTRIYAGMPHTVNQDEVQWFAGRLRELAAAGA